MQIRCSEVNVSKKNDKGIQRRYLCDCISVIIFDELDALRIVTLNVSLFDLLVSIFYNMQKNFFQR